MSIIDKIISKGVTYSIADSAARASLQGKYSKPITGIPKSDLAVAVRTSLEKADSLANKVEELEKHGIGKGWTDEQIDLLEAVFEKLVYTDAEGGTIAAQLIESLRGGVIPEEPITITFNGTTATISGLASTNTTFSGTTATIGG